MGIEEIIRDKRHAVLDAAAGHGARNMRVFGSVARGDATEHGDVDVLVTFEAGRSLLDHAGLQLELEEILGRPMEVASDAGLKPHLRERVLTEAVAL